MDSHALCFSTATTSQAHKHAVIPCDGQPGTIALQQDVQATTQHFVHGCPLTLKQVQAVFPFQQQALEYIDTCNALQVAPGNVSRLAKYATEHD
jgi:hypothetical protein